MYNPRYKFFNARWYSYQEWQKFLEEMIRQDQLESVIFPEIYEQKKELCKFFLNMDKSIIVPTKD